METCNAIQINGHVCNARINPESVMCRRHITARDHHGPNKYELMQLEYSYKKQRSDRTAIRLRDIENNVDNIDMIERTYANDLELFYLTYNITKREILLRHQRDIRDTGVNPDLEAENRRNRERLHIRHRDRVILQARLERLRIARRQVLDNQDADFRAGNVVEVQRQVGELEAFIQDKQNVHTEAAVKQTKDIVSILKTIPVPIEYQWDSINTSLTPFEIGMECKLSQKAAWQMISQYAQDTAIYDIEPGIYGKVLDSVWQYIKNSKEKSELCIVLKQEMEDNIGMCAQGNLSRVCNILAGYMSGIGSQESLSEKIGREISILMEMEDPKERVANAIKILQTNNVPQDQWDDWTNPLVEI